MKAALLAILAFVSVGLLGARNNAGHRVIALLVGTTKSRGFNLTNPNELAVSCVAWRTFHKQGRAGGRSAAGGESLGGCANSLAHTPANGAHPKR